MKHSILLTACVTALMATSGSAIAELEPKDMPGANAVPSEAADEQPEVIVDVTTAVNELPVLLVVPATEADRALAEQVRNQVQLTGLFNAMAPDKLGLGTGLPERNRWPALAQAVVVVDRVQRPDSTFPMIRSATYHRSMKQEIRRRELVEFPGATELAVPTLTDAIIEDVLGIRSHMSGKMLLTDASRHGERSVRVLSPDGQRGRRVSGFGVMARGGDFGEHGLISFAAEDSEGKLELFREGQRTPVALSMPGYVQGVAFSPDSKTMALSMGTGRVVQSWVGPSVDKMHLIEVADGRISLSPSVDNNGNVVHAVGGPSGPFAIWVNGKSVTTSGLWAAMPSFCSTAIEQRVVYMVRTGAHWEVRVTSLTNGVTRTVMTNAMAPACSPDGRTISAYSPGRAGKGPGVYLVGDEGGTPHKVWSGQATALRWAPGEPLPRRIVEAPPTDAATVEAAPTSSASAPSTTPVATPPQAKP